MNSRSKTSWSSSRRAARRRGRPQAQDDHRRHRQSDRRGIGQRRGRKVHRDGQPRRRTAQHGLPRRNSRRRYLRSLAAQDVRRGGVPARCGAGGGNGPHRSGRVDGHTPHVDRILHQTDRRPFVARRHGGQRPQADDPPDQMGNARFPARGPPPGTGDRTPLYYRRTENRRRGDRLDAPSRWRRPTWCAVWRCSATKT